MSSIKLENREEIVNALIPRVCENAPLRDVIRVYSEAVQTSLAQLDDEGLVNAIKQAGYQDFIDQFNLTESISED